VLARLDIKGFKMTISTHSETFAVLTDIAEHLDGTWDTKSSDNVVVRAFMVATGTLLRHRGTLDVVLGRARQDLKTLFTPDVIEDFGSLDPIGAVVEINELIYGTWSEVSEGNLLVQAFMRSTEFLLEKGALMNNGFIAQQYEEIKANLPQAPSI
jgi:hypothetical protein